MLRMIRLKIGCNKRYKHKPKEELRESTIHDIAADDTASPKNIGLVKYEKRKDRKKKSNGVRVEKSTRLNSE